MNLLTGTLTNGNGDDWSVEYRNGHVELWCKDAEWNKHSIILDMESMVALRDMINEVLWRERIE